MIYLFTFDYVSCAYCIHFYYENGIYYRISIDYTLNTVFDVMKYEKCWRVISSSGISFNIPEKLNIMDRTDIGKISLCRSVVEKLIFNKLLC